MEKEPIENLFEMEENPTEVQNAFVDLPPVAPVNYEEEPVMEENSEPVVSDNIVQSETDMTEEEKEIAINKEVLEHPDAKITLKKEEEEQVDQKEIEALKDIKLKDNSSLKFVLILGIIFLIVIFLIPVVSKYL